MSLSKDKIQASAAREPISTHRAYVYGACAPGYGEIYAGARLRGYITLSLFVLFSAWFCWTLVVIVRSVVGGIFDSLNGLTPLVLPNLPVAALGISFFGIYFLWLWAMLAAVDVAVRQRQKAGQPPQASVGWAVAIAWFCPGAGQIYTADDGWTLKTADGSVAAQFEHTVIITGDGPILATAV